MKILKLKKKLQNIKRYKASCTHKLLTLIPKFMWDYRGVNRRKTLYTEGENKYLKDLDCVNIVKSIRELKALTRIILNQQQRQILAFERESVLPSWKELEELNTNLIQNKVPFEYESHDNRQKYNNELEKFIDRYTQGPLSRLDYTIMDELENNRQLDNHPNEIYQTVLGTQISDINLGHH